MAPEESHHYEIDLRQDDLFIQLTSDDIYFISKQMERWFQIFIDDSYKPIAIPPTPALYPQPVRPAPPPEADPVPPPEPPKTDTAEVAVQPAAPEHGYEQALMAQIQQLQKQVEVLTQQTAQVQHNQAHPEQIHLQTAPKQPELPFTSEPLQTEPAPEETANEPVQEVPSLLESMPNSESSALDAFVLPAHSDFQGAFESFETVKEEPTVDLPNFEQPVNNTLLSVEKLAFSFSSQSLESSSVPTFEEQSPAFGQPVENSIQSLPNFGFPPPITSPAIDESSNDLDMLLDSLMSDLESKPAKDNSLDFMPDFTLREPDPAAQEQPSFPELPVFQKDSPPQQDTISNFAPESRFQKKVLQDLMPEPQQKQPEKPIQEVFPTTPLHDELSEVFSRKIPPIEQNTAPAATIIADLPFPESPLPEVFAPMTQTQLDFEASSLQTDSPTFQEEKPQLAEPEPFAPFEPLPTAASSFQPQSGNDDFETALGSIFEDSPADATDLVCGSFAPAEEEAAPVLETVPAQEYAPPEVKYDFGIPGPAATNDPTLRQLSLESLQVTEAEDFSSPFPDLTDADIEERQAAKVTEQYSSAKLRQETQAASASQQPMEEGNGQIESLMELCELAPNATSGADYLMLAAYFLATYRHLEKYALKDLNAQLVRSGMTPVNHGTLESVISRGFMQLVPDLTGTANAAEYALTDEGFTYTESLVNL